MEYSDFLKEVFEKIEKWDEHDLKWARDTLNGAEFQWNAFLAGCGFRYSEDTDETDYYKSRKNPKIYFRFSKACEFNDNDILGVYEKTEEKYNKIHDTLKSYVESDILERLDKIKKPKKSFSWSG